MNDLTLIRNCHCHFQSQNYLDFPLVFNCHFINAYQIDFKTEVLYKIMKKKTRRIKKLENEKLKHLI